MESSPISIAKLGTGLRNGKLLSLRVFDDKLTKLTDSYLSRTSISGSSRFVQTELVNRGSFGMSGAYGVSGVMKATSAVSGYFGAASATSNRQTTITCTKIVTEGIQALNTEELTLAAFIASLKENPRRQLLTVMKAYGKLISELKSAKSQCPSGNEETFDPTKSEEIMSAFETWNKAVEKFLEDNGDSFVSAVQWGAYGGAKLVLSEDSKASYMNYGADTEFSYAGINGAVSLKTAYAGSNSKGIGNVKMSVTAIVGARCLKDEFQKWVDALADKGFEKLEDQKLNSLAEQVPIPKNAKPELPNFEEPKKKDKKEAEDSLDEVPEDKENKGSEEAAAMVAFQKEKKHPNTQISINFNTFLVDARKMKNERKRVEETLEYRKYLQPNDEIFTESGGPENEGPPAIRAERFMHTEESSETSTDGDPFREFTPLGILICSWSELFPWFSRPIDNRLDQIEGVKRIVQWRMMIQDGLALAGLYRMAASINLSPPGGAVLDQLGDEFEQMTDKLQRRTTTGVNRDSDDYRAVMGHAYRGLGPDAKKIYKTWVDIGFLRTAELGLGVMKHSVESKSRSGLVSIKWIETYRNRPDYDWAEAKRAMWIDCEFNPDQVDKNFSAFREFVKVSPLILPDPEGKTHIYAFNSYGYLGHYRFEKRGYKQFDFGFQTEDKIKVGKTPTEHGYDRFLFKALRLEIDRKHECLSFTLEDNNVHWSNEDKILTLYPIPMGAAKGLSKPWIGPSNGSLSLSSSEDFNAAIKKVKEELSEKLQWKFVTTDFSEWWPSEGTLKEVGMNQLRANDYYIGMFSKAPDGMVVFSR